MAKILLDIKHILFMFTIFNLKINEKDHLLLWQKNKNNNRK